VLVHAAALNLGLLMRTLVGVGTPRSLQGRAAACLAGLLALLHLPGTLWTLIWTHDHPYTSVDHLNVPGDDRWIEFPSMKGFTTGC
jgi:hypothetical protein